MIGERVNNYRIVSVLGEGGMGSVYLAEHPFMGRKAAVKVLRKELADDRGLVERFMNEARAANAIRHPNIIDIIDVGLLPAGVPYLMMEFLEGESLGKRIERQRPMPAAEAIDVAAQTASALAAAHEKNIVHRDLKPDNLFLIPERGKPTGRIKVLDFGIAKLRGELSGSGARTQTGSIMGTPPYMSPEQCRGVDELDHRTDIYALGIILYEMLTGAPPFMSSGWGEVVHMHISQAPAPPRAKNPAVSAELEAIVLKALAKQPDARWGTMGELEAALRGAPRAAEATAGKASPALMAAVGGTAILSPSTTLRSSAGQIAAAGETLTPDEAATIGRSRARRPALVIGGVALAAAVAVAVGLGSRHAPATVTPAAPASLAAAPSAQPAVAAPSAPAPKEEIPPPPPAAAVAPPATVPVAEERPPAAEPPKPAPSEAPHRKNPAASKPSHHVAVSETAPAATSSRAVATATPPRKKPDCNPNYYFDAQARKHFKPECF